MNYVLKTNKTSHKPSRSLETVSIDLMGPLPTGRGGTHYILAILDTFSKYIKLYALKRATTKAVLKHLKDDFIQKMGTPETILTDNGTQFTSKAWSDQLKILNIKNTHSSKYHPQSNPVERYNREIGQLLRTYCSNQHSKWPNYLKVIEFWMNKVRSEITETTPIQIIEGTRHKHHLEQLIQYPTQPSEMPSEELMCELADRIKTKVERREKKKTNGNKRLN